MGCGPDWYKIVTQRFLVVNHEISHLSLAIVFSWYMCIPSDSWNIPWYTTRKRCITSMYIHCAYSTTLVRPHVEYASSVCDPHLKKHVKQIEGAQKRAARLVKNCYTREPGTVTNLVNELIWIYLKVGGIISRLTTLFHKAIYGDGGLAFADYVMKRRRHMICRVYGPFWWSETLCLFWFGIGYGFRGNYGSVHVWMYLSFSILDLRIFCLRSRENDLLLHSNL